MLAVFVSISDSRIAALIDASASRVVFAAPGVRMSTAGALGRAVQRLGHENVVIVVDCNEEVFRLGYGQLDAILHLREAGCRVRQSVGLRVGVLVCDARAWAFAPTALYVEPEVQSDETPNAIALTGSSIDDIVGVVTGAGRDASGNGLPAEVGPIGSGKSTVHGRGPKCGPPDIGVEDVSDQEITRATDALKQAPPIPFDIARQVRVFEPYIQYVEISLRGCAIQRHRIEVPKTIQGLDAGSEMSARLRTTFELIERNNEVSSRPLEENLKKIRDDFTRPLGKPWGRVLLRASRPLFDERIAAFKARLDEHRQSVVQSLEKNLELSRKQLVDYFLPMAQQAPPDSLLGQVSGRPTKEQVSEWLDAELLRVFPEPSDLVSDMTLDVQFRDVTYETLKEEGFGEKLRAAYPHVDWDKPFTEFDAARAREDHAPKTPASGI